MKKLLVGTAFCLAGSFVQAQTQQDLLRDGNGGSTENVLTYGMGYHQQRYSRLDQVNRRNVGRLVPIWNLSLNNDLGEQAQPIVYDGVMYVVNVKRVVAIDVATGRQIWTSQSEWDPATARVVCCGLSTRGVAVYNGKVFVPTIDAHLKAFDAKTGKEIWTVALPAGASKNPANANANPMSYLGKSGKQYVAIVAGSTLVSYAIP